jgi:hypothetical protein
MEIPFTLFLNLIVGFVYLFFWGVVFVILYHLTRFGIGVQPKRFAGIFLFGVVILFCLNIFIYARLDLNSFFL